MMMMMMMTMMMAEKNMMINDNDDRDDDDGGGDDDAAAAEWFSVRSKAMRFSAFWSADLTNCQRQAWEGAGEGKEVNDRCG